MYAGCCFAQEHTSEVPTLVLDFELHLLPLGHPAHQTLQELCADPSIFDTFDTLKKVGFTIENMPGTEREWSIMVASHPTLEGCLIKKYPNQFPINFQLENYLARIRGAKQIAQYIEQHEFKHVVVPKKWLFRLPARLDDSDQENYLLVVEKIDILPGGYWGGPVLNHYAAMQKEVMQELCMILHDLGGCDAWPQNQPFTKDGKIAFIDTENLDKSFGDFIFRSLNFINPDLFYEAVELWKLLDIKQLDNQESPAYE